MVLPAFVALMALVGMAFSAEPQSDFRAGLGDDRAVPETAGDDVSPDEPDDGPGGLGDIEEPATEVDPDTAASGEEQESTTEAAPDSAITFEVQGLGGRVGVRLDPDGADLAFPLAGDGVSGIPTELTGDGLPAGAGLRLEGSGELRLAPRNEMAPGEIVLTPATDGVDVGRADGGSLQIRATAQGAVSVVDVSADGQPTPVAPSPDGVVEVGDGVIVQFPTETGEIPAPTEPGRFRWRLFLTWVLTTAAVSLALAYVLHRRAGPLYTGIDFTPPPELPVRGFSEFLDLLRADTDPARAIRLAFEGAEKGLGTLPARRPIETPFEWHARVAADQPYLDQTLITLCSLFTTARFAPDRPTDDERDEAVDRLHHLADLAGYREPTPPGAGPGPSMPIMVASE